MTTFYEDVPGPHREDATWPATYCPGCRRYGRFRAGCEFSHEMRCGKCDIVWAPHVILSYRESLAYSLAGTGGDGI